MAYTGIPSPYDPVKCPFIPPAVEQTVDVRIHLRPPCPQLKALQIPTIQVPQVAIPTPKLTLPEIQLQIPNISIVIVPMIKPDGGGGGGDEYDPYSPEEECVPTTVSTIEDVNCHLDIYQYEDASGTSFFTIRLSLDLIHRDYQICVESSDQYPYTMTKYCEAGWECDCSGGGETS